MPTVQGCASYRRQIAVHALGCSHGAGYCAEPHPRCQQWARRRQRFPCIDLPTASALTLWHTGPCRLARHFAYLRCAYRGGFDVYRCRSVCWPGELASLSKRQRASAGKQAPEWLRNLAVPFHGCIEVIYTIGSPQAVANPNPVGTV